MTDPETPPPPGSPKVTWVKKRRPFEDTISPMQNAATSARLFLLAALTVAFAAVAGYMALVEHRPLTSAYVIAPAIGALWFAVRLFMQLMPKAR